MNASARRKVASVPARDPVLQGSEIACHQVGAHAQAMAEDPEPENGPDPTVIFSGMLARFFKITPRQDWPRELDNKTWWRGHLAFQYAGGAATVVALGLILFRPEVADDSGPHRVVGWTVAGLAAVQFLAGWLRGTKGGPTAPTPDGSWFGDHYNMTLQPSEAEDQHGPPGGQRDPHPDRRVRDPESGQDCHRSEQNQQVPGGLVDMLEEDAPKGPCGDTNHAIWGPDSRHPGNNMKPIGWGIRRL